MGDSIYTGFPLLAAGFPAFSLEGWKMRLASAAQVIAGINESLRSELVPAFVVGIIITSTLLVTGTYAVLKAFD